MKQFITQHKRATIAALLIGLLAIFFPPALLALPFIFGAILADVNAETTYANISPPAARTTTVTSATVDLRDYMGVVKVTQDVGTVSGTTPTLAGKLQEGNQSDGSDATDITGATFTQVTASTNVQSIAVNTRAVKRYLRYVGTIGGTSPTFNMAVSLVGQKQTQ